MTGTSQQQDDINKDLGFGARVAQGSHRRFLNRDGSFNVQRTGFSMFGSLSMYHAVLTMSWVRFFALILGGYLVMNLFFALAFFLAGPEALKGVTGGTAAERLVEAFFFSVQTSATIGYGLISPNSLLANILVTIEALAGLLGFALATGLLFARFSRPTGKIIFSDRALIAPYKGKSAFEFRIVNERSNQLIEVEGTVVLSRLEKVGGQTVRKFHPLTLERNKVMFMPLHWVLVHAIDESSPLFGISKEIFDASDAEVLILLTGIDETFSATVHARTSYKPDEIVWGAKFRDMFLDGDGSLMSIDLRRIHDIEPAQL